MPHRALRPRVVIADDHPSVLAAFQQLLKESCEIVGAVPNGLDAVDAVERLRPDVLVLDLMMPDLDGLEVCRRVKRIAPDTEVVIVTAFDDPHVRTVAVEIGASAFVPKHSAATKLQHTVHRLFVERRSAAKESATRTRNAPDTR
jgi:DNA-binding NarL/FixJ family response regulator